jgi:hypothetical protein
MWIYVICRECGRNVARGLAQAEIAPCLPIEMDDGQLAADIFECECETCFSARVHQPIPLFDHRRIDRASA